MRPYNKCLLIPVPMTMPMLHLHLSSSTRWNMTGNLKGARVHVDIAKEIDPDFCDVGYQEAILQVGDERQEQGLGEDGGE
jgi:hypothetical protein